MRAAANNPVASLIFTGQGITFLRKCCMNN
jgi:hypothetical protein